MAGDPQDKIPLSSLIIENVLYIKTILSVQQSCLPNLLALCQTVGLSPEEKQCLLIYLYIKYNETFFIYMSPNLVFLKKTFVITASMHIFKQQ